MFESTRKYVVEYVLSSYNDFFEYYSKNDWGENQLLRRGIISANAIFHLREQIPPDIRPTKKALKSKCQDYGLIADIANVAKHHNISNDNPQISSASQIFEAMIITMFSDEDGQYYYPQNEVIVRLDDGTERKLVNILSNVMCMWFEVLEQLGIAKFKTIKPLTIDSPITRDEASRRSSNLSITQGEDYKWQIRMMKYNYEKYIAEPMDLTGMNFQFRISKLPEQIPIIIHISNSKTATEIVTELKIPLSEELATQYISLKSDEEKTTFLEKIIESDPNIKNAYESKIKSAVLYQISKDSQPNQEQSTSVEELE